MMKGETNQHHQQQKRKKNKNEQKHTHTHQKDPGNHKGCQRGIQTN